MNMLPFINNAKIDIELIMAFPYVKYVRWGCLPDADTYVVHEFHCDDIPRLLPFLFETNTTICVVPQFDRTHIWMGMTYPDFEKLYDAAAPSLNYSYCDPYDKEYELMYSRETDDGELVSDGHNHYVIGNYNVTDEGCTGCGKVVTSNRKRSICPNCGEEVYMS